MQQLKAKPYFLTLNLQKAEHCNGNTTEWCLKDIHSEKKKTETLKAPLAAPRGCNVLYTST